MRHKVTESPQSSSRVQRFNRNTERLVNIFVLSEDPVQAAQDMCNKHVVKMIVESAQILSTVYRLKMEERWDCLSHKVADNFPRLYRATHVGHPAVKWVSSSVHNAEWLWQHQLALVQEYVNRYKKFHKTQTVINELDGVRYGMWKSFGDWRLHTEFVQCMPEAYRNSDAVTAYRSYYVGEKAKFARWAPHAKAPAWWPESQA